MKSGKLNPYECPVCKKSGFTPKEIHTDNALHSECAATRSYYDPVENKHHHHDRNRYSMGFSCSNGHRWLYIWKRECCLEFPGYEEIQVLYG